MSALVLIAAVVLGTISCYVLFGQNPNRRSAHFQAHWFQERIREFRQHTKTLEEHSDEYCSVFGNDEWTKLNNTLTRLEHVNTDIQGLLAQKNYSQAISILERINNPVNATSPLDDLDKELHHFEELINWERSVHGLLKKVMVNLEVAASNTRDLSKAKAARSTRPTLVTLADLKKVLLEDEELKKLTLR